MKEIYLPIEPYGYRKYDVQEDLPVMVPFTEVAPGEELVLPRFNFTTNSWEDLKTDELMELIKEGETK